MKNKASLSLMEQLVMLLVFALAAALCLGIFARAGQIGQTTTRRETAAQIAQNGAELLKSGGKLEELPLPEGYSAAFHPQDQNIPGLISGTLEVCHHREQAPLFSLTVAWQEVSP